MGSAAPSARRWLSVALLLAAVASFVLLRPGSDEVEPPALNSQRVNPEEAGRPAAATVGVALGPGRTVPALVGDADAHGGHEAHGGHDVAMLEVGSPTVGGAVAVTENSSSFVIHGVGERHLAYRLAQGADWGDWFGLSATDHDAPDGLDGEEGSTASQIASAPVPLDDSITEVEFVVVGGDTSSFDVTFLGTATTDQPLNPAGAVIGDGRAAMTGAPTIIGRDQWASFEWDYQNEDCDEGPSIADHLSTAVIHHTVTSNSYAESDVVGLLRAIHYSHVVINGWCDIGYNFVVDRFGRIWEARTGSIDNPVIGGHSRGFNTSTVGIALLGQHHPGARPSSADVSTAAEAAVEAVAHWKLGIHGVDPGGKAWLRNRSSSPPLRLAGDSWHYLPTIVGHRDLGATSCPGNHGADLVQALPARLNARRDVSLPYTFVDWRAHSHGPGFVMADALGGVRPAGTASPWPQAPVGLSGGEAILAVDGDLNGGYLLSSGGSVIGYGASPAVSGVGSVANAVDIVVRSDARSGWVLDRSGTLHGFGGAGTLGASGAPSEAVAAAVDDAGSGYVLDAGGTLHSVGGAAPIETDGRPGAGVQAVDVDLDPSASNAKRGWVLDRTGRLHGFGGAVSTRVTPPDAVVAVSVAETESGGWVLDASGQLWPFGGARLIFPVSTNSAAGNAVDMANVGMLYTPAFTNSPDARFVQRIYELFLGRAPRPAEADVQVAGLEQGKERFDLTSSLATSEFWAGSTIDQMYVDVLGRPPDADGRAYWLGEIGNGLTVQDLGTYFYGSQEYANRAGSTEAYVRGLYRALLHREPDPDGLSYWVGVLGSGQAAPPDVANGFFASIESRRDRASTLHARILGTAPTTDETEFWAERLAAAGDVAVAAELAATSDYYHLAVNGPEP